MPDNNNNTSPAQIATAKARKLGQDRLKAEEANSIKEDALAKIKHLERLYAEHQGLANKKYEQRGNWDYNMPEDEFARKTASYARSAQKYKAQLDALKAENTPKKESVSATTSAPTPPKKKTDVPVAAIKAAREAQSSAPAATSTPAKPAATYTASTQPAETFNSPKLTPEYALKELDYAKKAATTVDQIKDIQRRLGVTEDGIFGDETNKAFNKAKRAAYIRTAKGIEEDTKIKAIQQKLGLKADGVWGVKTQTAWENSQRPSFNAAVQPLIDKSHETAPMLTPTTTANIANIAPVTTVPTRRDVREYRRGLRNQSPDPVAQAVPTQVAQTTPATSGKYNDPYGYKRATEAIDTLTQNRAPITFTPVTGVGQIAARKKGGILYNP
jgi:hypothetical protein